MEDEIDKKIRLIQAKEIITTNSSVSYSQIINEVLRRQLK